MPPWFETLSLSLCVCMCVCLSVSLSLGGRGVLRFRPALFPSVLLTHPYHSVIARAGVLVVRGAVSLHMKPHKKDTFKVTSCHFVIARAGVYACAGVSLYVNAYKMFSYENTYKVSSYKDTHKDTYKVTPYHVLIARAGVFDACRCVLIFESTYQDTHKGTHIRTPYHFVIARAGED